MNDLNPPPERDLDRRHRDAIRSVLADAAPERHRRVGAPLLAAAAVGAVVAAGIAVTRAADDPAPAGGAPGTPTASLTVAPSGKPEPTLSVPHFPERTEGRTVGTVGPRPEPPAKPLKDPLAICRELLTEYAGNSGEGVPGKDARVVATTTGRWGTTMVLADGRYWAGCDTAGYTTNKASLREPARIDKPSARDSKAFAVDEYNQSLPSRSDSTVPWHKRPPEPSYQYFWAAGLVPDGVAKIMYTFPGGRTAFAQVTGDYWVMQYEGDRIAPGDVDRANITVTLTRADGSVVRKHSLVWGEETCAVVNHGC